MLLCISPAPRRLPRSRHSSCTPGGRPGAGAPWPRPHRYASAAKQNRSLTTRCCCCARSPPHPSMSQAQRDVIQARSTSGNIQCLGSQLGSLAGLTSKRGGAHDLVAVQPVIEGTGRAARPGCVAALGVGSALLAARRQRRHEPALRQPRHVDGRAEQRQRLGRGSTLILDHSCAAFARLAHRGVAHNKLHQPSSVSAIVRRTARLLKP